MEAARAAMSPMKRRAGRPGRSMWSTGICCTASATCVVREAAEERRGIRREVYALRVSLRKCACQVSSAVSEHSEEYEHGWLQVGADQRRLLEHAAQAFTTSTRMPGTVAAPLTSFVGLPERRQF